MKKMIFILVAGVAAALVAAAGLLVLAEPRAKKPPLTNLPVRTVLRDARPLVWLDERYLLAGVDDKIVKLDSRDPRIVETVSAPYHAGVGYECFSREGGTFPVTEPEKNGTSISYQNMVYRWIEDWNQPAHFEDFKTSEAWNTNPHDCSAVEYKEARGDEQAAQQMLKAVDGRTKVYYRGGPVESPYERVVTIERDGHTKEVWLETTPGFISSQIRVRSTFDESSGRYLWYLETSDFDIAGRHWPLKAWWVAREGRVTKIVLLPNGPWIRPFTTLYLLKSFSCGPPCYSHMEMWAGNERIYIAVWGDAIARAVEGVYRLDASGNAWEKIIAGALDNGLVLSPSGCQLGYAARGQLHVMSVCENLGG